MPVRPTPIEFPLSGGIDTKTDSKLVQLPKFLDAQNVVFTKHGSLVKRKGYTALANQDTSSATLSGLKALATRGDELVSLGDNLYSFSAVTDTWYSQGELPRFTLTATDGTVTPGDQTEVVSATDASLRVTAWEEAGGLYYSVYDIASEAVLQSATLINASAERAQVIYTGSNFLISYVRTDTSSINILAVSGTNLTGTTTELQLSDFHTDYLYDMVWDEDGDNTGGNNGWAVLAYKDTTAGQFRVLFLNNAGALHGNQAPVTNTGPSAAITNYISCSKTPGTTTNRGPVHIVWSTASTTESETYYNDASTDGMNTVASSSSVGATVIQLRQNGSGDKLHWLVDDGTDIIKYTTTSTSGAPTSNSTFASGASLAGKAMITKAITDDETTAEWVVPIHYGSTLQNTIHLLNKNALVIAALSSGLANLQTAGYPMVEPNWDSTNVKVTLAVSEKQLVDVADAQEDGYSQAQVKIYDLDISKNASIDTVEMRDSLYVGGSLLWKYDGNEVSEAGFLFFPELDKTTFTQSGATLDTSIDNLPFNINRTDGGAGSLTLKYYAVYEQYDNTGKRIQSAFVPITCTNFTDPGTDNVTFTLPAIPFTNKSNVRTSVYRTHNDSVAIAYRLSTAIGADASSASTFTDNTAEANLKSGEIFYGSSGELANGAPFAGASLLSHDDRIFYVPDRDKSRVYFSKRPGEFEPPGFNKNLFVQLPPDGGNITALGVLDNKLIIFKRDRIYMVSGTGPNNLGVGSYTLPRLISTDTGCKDRNSVVRVPQGVMFQSDKGIYWVNRGETVSYIGADAETYNSQTITDATLLPDERQVIFLINGVRTLAFNYDRASWTTFTQHAGLSAVHINDTYYYLRADGSTVYKSSSDYLDNGQAITVLIKTPWVRPQGAQQLWHLRKAMILGNYLSTHDIKVTINFNFDEDYLGYDSTWNPEASLNVGTLGGNATLGGGDLLGIPDATQPDRVYQFGHILKHQRIQSVRFTFTEVPPAASPGASFELTSLALSAAGYQDLFKLPGSKEI